MTLTREDYEVYRNCYKSLNNVNPTSRPTEEEYDRFMKAYDELYANAQEYEDKELKIVLNSLNTKLGTNFTSVTEVDRALAAEQDMDRYNILLEHIIMMP